MLREKKYGVRVLAINVPGINEEEAGALNGHDARVKNDCARHRRVFHDTIDVLLEWPRGDFRNSIRKNYISRSLRSRGRFRTFRRRDREFLAGFIRHRAR